MPGDLFYPTAPSADISQKEALQRIYSDLKLAFDAIYALGGRKGDAVIVDGLKVSGPVKAPIKATATPEELITRSYADAHYGPSVMAQALSATGEAPLHISTLPGYAAARLEAGDTAQRPDKGTVDGQLFHDETSGETFRWDDFTGTWNVISSASTTVWVRSAPNVYLSTLTDSVSIGASSVPSGTKFSVVGVAAVQGAAAFRWYDSDDSNYVSFAAPGTVASNNTYTLPTGYPAVSGYVLASTTLGVMSWAASTSLPAVSNDGYTVISASDGTWQAQPLTAGANITITPGAHSITITANATTGAPTDAQYVTLALNSNLSDERVLTGTTNQVTITDNGANSTVVLSLPQNIHTAATPQFARLGLGAAADATALLNLSGTTAPSAYVTVADNSNDPQVILRRARAGPADLSNADVLGELIWHGYLSSAYAELAKITAHVQLAASSTSRMTFYVRDSTDVGSAPVLMLEKDHVSVGLGLATLNVGWDGTSSFDKTTGQLRLHGYDNTPTARAITIVPPTGQSGFVSYTLTLPTTAGTSTYVPVTNGSGTLSWDSRIRSLNGLIVIDQVFGTVYDTNVTLDITSSGTTHLFTVGWTGELEVARGGTGRATLTSNGVLYGNGTIGIGATASALGNFVLHGGSPPTFALVNLTNEITGTLAAASGGTGVSTASANTVFSGPTSGGAAVPAFRTLVAADYVTLVGDSGAGGTKGAAPAPSAGDAAAGKFLKADATWAVPPGGGGSPAFSSITSGTNTVPAAMVIGAGSSLTVTGTGTNTATALTGNPAIAVSNIDVRSYAAAAPTASQLHFSSTNTTAGGYLTSAGASNFFVSCGVQYDGTNWIARSTSMSIIGGDVGEVRFYNATGLTSGVAVNFGTQVAQINLPILTAPVTDTIGVLAASQTFTNKNFTSNCQWQGVNIPLAYGGTGASLVDPGADRIVFWDDSAGTIEWLSLGSGLSITGTVITATTSGTNYWQLNSTTVSPATLTNAVGIGNISALTGSGTLHVGDGTGIVNTTYTNSVCLMEKSFNVSGTYAATLNVQCLAANGSAGTYDRFAIRTDAVTASVNHAVGGIWCYSGITSDATPASTGPHANGGVFDAVQIDTNTSSGRTVGSGRVIGVEPAVRNKQTAPKDVAGSNFNTFSTSLWVANHCGDNFGTDSVGCQPATAGIIFAPLSDGAQWITGMMINDVTDCAILLDKPRGFQTRSGGNPTAGYWPLQTKTISGASGTPISITTTTAHGLTNGQAVAIAGVLGNTAANGNWNITSTGTTTFTLDGSTTSGVYSGGGTLYYTSTYTVGADGSTVGINFVTNAKWSSAIIMPHPTGSPANPGLCSRDTGDTARTILYTATDNTVCLGWISSPPSGGATRIYAATSALVSEIVRVTIAGANDARVTIGYGPSQSRALLYLQGTAVANQFMIDTTSTAYSGPGGDGVVMRVESAGGSDRKVVFYNTNTGGTATVGPF